MDDKLLFDGEEVITESTDRTVTLTNYRIRCNDSEFGKAHLISMMLEQISTIEIHYRSKVKLLISGVIIAIAGFIYSQGMVRFLNLDGLLFIIIGFILIVAYFFTRKYVISITSDSGIAILIDIKGMKMEDILDFVNDI